MKRNREVEEHILLRVEAFRATINKIKIVNDISWRDLGRIMGISGETLRKFAVGETKNLSLVTELKLSVFLYGKSSSAIKGFHRQLDTGRRLK